MVKIFRKRLWRSSLLVKLQVGLWFYYKWIPSQVFFKDYGIKFTEHLLGAISGFWISLFSPRIIFKGFVKTQKAAGVNGIINLVNLEVFHGMLWQCSLTCKLSFLNCWKIYLLRRRYPKDQDLKILN